MNSKGWCGIRLVKNYLGPSDYERITEVPIFLEFILVRSLRLGFWVRQRVSFFGSEMTPMKSRKHCFRVQEINPSFRSGFPQARTGDRVAMACRERVGLGRLPQARTEDRVAMACRERMGVGWLPPPRGLLAR